MQRHRVAVSSSRRCRSQRGGGQLAEFGPALMIFVLMLFPLINLIMYTCAVATCELIARQTAQAAGTSSTFSTGLASAQAEANKLITSPWGQFAKITPNGGYSGCGVDLWITTTPVGPPAGAPTRTGPNTPMTGTINASANIYEYTSTVHFIIKPFVPLGTLPFIGNVPIIGQSAQFNIDWSSAAEFPDGLTQ